MDLRYEPFAAEHAVHLHELVADPDIRRFTRVPDPVPPGFVEAWPARYEASRAVGTQEGWAVFDDERGGLFAGLALAPSIDAEAREVELGYLVAPAARGRGVATEMLRFLTRWAFEEAGAMRAQLLINFDNAASQAVARRCGYVLDGTLRSLHLKGDVRVDTQVWSRLPTDPQP